MKIRTDVLSLYRKMSSLGAPGVVNYKLYTARNAPETFLFSFVINYHTLNMGPNDTFLNNN